VVVVLLLPFFSYVPLAIIACILMLVAVRMAPLETLVHLWKQDKVECGLMVTVCAVSVGLDPTYGLVMGMVIAFFINADNVSKVHTEILMLDRSQAAALSEIETRPMHTILRPDMRETMVRAITCDPLETDTTKALSDIELAAGSVMVYEPRGALTYLNADGLEEQMKECIGLKQLVIAMDKVYFVDVDGVDRIGKLVKRMREEGTTVVLCGCTGKGVEKLLSAEWYQAMTEDGFVAGGRGEAHDMIKFLSPLNGVKGKDEQGSPDISVETPSKFDIEVALADGSAGVPNGTVVQRVCCSTSNPTA